CFFTHDTSSVARHRSAGARAYYLAFGCDPVYLRPRDAGRRWRAPLVFVRSRDPVRERVLRELPDLGLVTWGPGWPNGPVYRGDYVRALAGGSVGLNVHQQFGDGGDPARYGTGANMRVFELAAVGTPQLADAKQDIARHFTPGREIVLYHSVPELRDRARELLADRALQRALAGAARERAMRERAAPGAEHRRAREQRFDRHETERLVPFGRIPETARAREQRRLGRAVDFADVLDRAREARPPAAGHDQAVARALRRLDRPVVALRPGQIAQEQVVPFRSLGH